MKKVLPIGIVALTLGLGTYQKAIETVSIDEHTIAPRISKYTDFLLSDASKEALDFPTDIGTKVRKYIIPDAQKYVVIFRQAHFNDLADCYKTNENLDTLLKDFKGESDPLLKIVRRNCVLDEKQKFAIEQTKILTSQKNIYDAMNSLNKHGYDTLHVNALCDNSNTDIIKQRLKTFSKTWQFSNKKPIGLDHIIADLVEWDNNENANFDYYKLFAGAELWLKDEGLVNVLPLGTNLCYNIDSDVALNMIPYAKEFGILSKVSMSDDLLNLVTLNYKSTLSGNYSTNLHSMTNCLTNIDNIEKWNLLHDKNKIGLIEVDTF